MSVATRPLPSLAPARRLRGAASCALAATLLALSSPGAFAQLKLPYACGSLENAYGPFDYRNEKTPLKVVEGFHFNADVEMLVKGLNGSIGSDLDYTLRAAPNHHRALISMMKYGERLKQDQVPGAKFSVDCYFQRAAAWRPDDTTVRMIYAVYLNGRGRQDEALRQLLVVDHFAEDNAVTHYNLGMVYLEFQQFDLAVQHAQRALELGLPRTDLKERLIAANKWAEAASAPR